MARPVVDLPQPLSPTNDNVSPDPEIKGHILHRMHAAAEPSQKAGVNIEALGQPFYLEHRLGTRVNGIARPRWLLRFACGGVDDGKSERSFLTRHRTQNRNGGQKRAGVGMLAAMENIGSSANFHLLAAIHDNGTVGDLRHHAHIMGDEQNRRAFLLLKRLDEVKDLALNGHIECGRRLVGDQQLRPGCKRHGDHHALAHAAGKAMRIFIETRCG